VEKEPNARFLQFLSKYNLPLGSKYAKTGTRYAQNE
jgi:hypothetical protein